MECSPGWVLRQRFTQEVVCAVFGSRWKMMMLCRLIYQFTVNKMILKYQWKWKHELTNDMMKRLKKGKELWDTANLNRWFSTMRRCEHDGQFWTDRLLLQILKKKKKRVEAKDHPETTKRICRACTRRLIRTCKDIATQIAGILALASVWTAVAVWLDNKRHSIALFVSRSNGAERWKQHMRSSLT